mmetsp:Transcript_42793/g.71150  ORF Transcript_42793/g.71150 Transcript_42793/m.71150 type:complete len:271 (+) Transcript_42793:1439-2251(+)
MERSLMSALQSMVMVEGKPTKTGGVRSLRVMSWSRWAKLPQASVAVQVRVTGSSQPVPGETSDLVTVTVLQLSVAVGAVTGRVEPHSRVVSAGKVPVKTGMVLSTRVMVWVTESVLPQPSLVVKVRTICLVQASMVVVTSAEVTVVVAALQASVAVGRPRAATVVTEPHSRETSAGALVRTGAMLSETVMTWMVVTAVVQPSEVEKVRVMVLSQLSPVVRSEKVTGKTPQESNEVGEPRSMTEVEEPHSRSTLEGVPEREGWTLSVTVMT